MNELKLLIYAENDHTDDREIEVTGGIFKCVDDQEVGEDTLRL